ncbi:MAG: hypothetical protein HY741_01570 [Chloroflexi bacterium]|nr:hypothetical protein [Chloroflexota bacterium]
MEGVVLIILVLAVGGAIAVLYSYALQVRRINSKMDLTDLQKETRWLLQDMVTWQRENKRTLDELVAAQKETNRLLEQIVAMSKAPSDKQLSLN